MTESMTTNYVATFLFGIALMHTFSVGYFREWATKYPEGSVQENFFHLMGEVEIVFGLWAGVFCLYLSLNLGTPESIQFLESQNFTEPVFVFVIMALSATKPILNLATSIIVNFSRLLPLSRNISFYFSALVLGPMLGSLITEPAAMTVTAMILKKHLFDRVASAKLKYATLGLLFVSISVGGTLTHFAAPPVLMVASKWGWDTPFMLSHFGLKAFVAVLVSTVIYLFYFRNEINKIDMGLGPKKSEKFADALVEASERTPAWLMFLHLVFLAHVVIFAHHMVVFVGVFLFFLGLFVVTREYQTELKLKEALLVAFFLGGLVVLGSPQRWWLEPLLGSLDQITLFFGATGLTAITDNAALTYLGSQVPDLSDAAKYALVAGAVTGGGLTVIANAPNPAGYGILQDSFGDEGIRPLGLLLAALIPTLVASACFLLIPSF